MTYAAAVLADNPTTFLRMDEAASGTLADSSGNGNNWGEDFSQARTYGNTTPSGKAIGFTTAGTRYSKFSGGSVRSVDALTWEFVAKVPNHTTDYIVIGATSQVYANTGYCVGFKNGKLRILIANTTNRYLGDAVIDDGNYHHCAVSYDGTTWRGVVDGVSQNATATDVPTAMNGGQSINLGVDGGGSIFGAADGLQIGDLAFYHAKLSTAQIAAHAVAGTYAVAAAAPGGAGLIPALLC